MVIRIITIFICIISYWVCGQDSVTVSKINKEYSTYYYSTIKSMSPSERYLVQNDFNSYGKNDFLLKDIKSGTVKNLPIAKSFSFLNDDFLLIETLKGLIFYNISNGMQTEILGKTVKKTLNEKLILASTFKPDELALYNTKGEELWKRSGVLLYDFQEKGEYVSYTTKDSLVLMNMMSRQELKNKLPNITSWLKIIDGQVWTYGLEGNKILLNSYGNRLDVLSSNEIDIPKNYEMLKDFNFRVEIRENRYFIIPLFKIEEAKPSNVKISYTNKNSTFPLPQLAIYNTLTNSWLWKPKSVEENQESYFLNDKGDFITFDLTKDTIENKNNPLLEIKLVRDYGRKVLSLGKMHSHKDNYYFDDISNQLLFFKNRQWWLMDLVNSETMPISLNSKQSWADSRYNGLTEKPFQPVIKTSDPSKVIISSNFDLFMLDFKNRKLKRLTYGEAEGIIYQFVFDKELRESEWGLNLKTVDLKKESILKMFNTQNYDSGFAKWKNDKLPTPIIYGKYNFASIFHIRPNIYATSQMYQQPLQIIKLGNKKAEMIYHDSNLNPALNSNLKMENFQYKTSLKQSNAVLLYPENYDPNKKYPMIVNIYEDTAKRMLENTVANLHPTDGFNSMHYVKQGYFVLLPQLQYAEKKVAEQFIISLEAAVNMALSKASIDKENMAVLGMSFGGYEAGLAISQSNLFKTASLGVMISDLISFSHSYANILWQPNYIRTETQQFSMVDSPFDDWQPYLESSPIYHMKKVTQPVLIWGGTNDKNVLPTQSAAFFIGLKRLGKKAVFLEYINEQHQIVTPANQQDLAVKTWQWMEYFLKNKPPAEWIQPLIK